MTKKLLSFILIVGLTNSIHAQHGLLYNKPFVECEDKWVIFNAPKDSSHAYGFIYIDAMAGLTFQYEGNITIGTDGKFSAKPLLANGQYKVRLQPNNVKVAIIPAERFAELGITDPPEWLSIYKSTKDSVARMVRWGYYYNHWNMSEKALTYLEKAKQLEPGKEGLAFELSYAYNALEQFNKAIPILEEAIAKDPANCLLYKEYSYALIGLEKMKEAEDACESGIKHCEDKKMKAEIAYNLAYNYYMRKDKDNFNIWAEKTLKWAEAESIFARNIGLIKKEFK